MTTMAARLEAGLLERKFRFAEHGTTLARDTFAGMTTFVVMSYIIFVNPAILSFAGITGLENQGLAFDAVLASTCLVAGVMTILMGLVANKAYAIAPGMGLNAVVAFGLVLGAGLSWPEAMGIVVLEGALVTVLVLTGMRESIMKAVPLELKKAIAIGIGLFIAFIGLYNSGLITKAAAPGLPVELGSFTTWPVFTTIVGLIITIVLRARGYRGALLLGIIATTAFALIVNKATDYDAGFTAGAVWPSDIVSRAELLAARRVQLRGVRDARRRLCARLGVRALPVGLLRHDGHARRRREARRVPEQGRRHGQREAAAAHRLALGDGRRGSVLVVRDDVHRVGCRRRSRRPHGLDERRHGRAVLPVPLPRTADRDGAAAGDGARADHRRLAADQLAHRVRRRSRRGRDRSHRREA